jgi:hypothetical protein
MVALLRFLLKLLLSPLRPAGRLEAENAALRQQVIILQRKMRGRIEFTHGDRFFFIQLPLVSLGSECHHYHPAPDAGALASGGLPPLLALEVAQPRRTAADPSRVAGIDQADERRECCPCSKLT